MPMHERKLQNQKIIDRLMKDHKFKEIRSKAKKDRKNISKYALQVRQEFNLSPYWTGFIEWLLAEDGLVTKIPMTGGMIDTTTDQITGKDYYSIPVYPETTDSNIKSTIKTIRSRYKERGEVVDIRKTDPKNDSVEFRALELHESGENYQDIADILGREFDETYIDAEIPTLIHKAKKKSLRQEDVS
jgi:hypothetical protein